MMFEDRTDAGRRLAQALAAHAGEGTIVLALPRGGVPVAAEVARALRAPLDLVMVRKIGAPGHPEYGIGAVVDGAEPQIVVDEAAARLAGADDAYLADAMRRELAEIERRRRAYLGDRRPLDVAGRTVVVVDDGAATGSTAKAALRALKKAGAARRILAVPVAPIETVEALRTEADEVVALTTPYPFHAVGLSYEDFDQTTDEEVVAALEGVRG
ncbi:phosphoribosyltransferase [Salinarimonas chemoclinalis]|uniref:phosphoribosyltransferase n=1 Tax=Salinarimonas chemoclinalis TaxID=3241599 RepID=UPI003557FB5C